MKKRDSVVWREPSAFHTSAFDLGITPLQAFKNTAHFGLSTLFFLADIENDFLTAQSKASQDHRYVRMNAKKEEGEDQYKISLQIMKGSFTDPEICTEFNIPGTVPKQQAIRELDSFERTCLSAGASIKQYTYVGWHYSAANKPVQPSRLKNG